MVSTMSYLLLALCCTVLPPQESPAKQPVPNTREFVSLFNGKNLDGWTPKIRGFALGDNHNDTFRVENGILKVAYDKYTTFDGKFGHLFYRDAFSHYVLRVEYRFVGNQAQGGPGWAIRNSGAMLHCQPPETMEKDQDFPISIEAQFLGGSGQGKRSTGNVCTPGTHIVMGGKLITQHCNNSKSKTYHGDQWVTIDMEVRGSGKIRHLIDGEVILEYEQPQYDPGDADTKKFLATRKGLPLLISEGYISLQAESHPVEFRKVEIKLLEKGK
jgi:hypothetical protein